MHSITNHDETDTTTAIFLIVFPNLYFSGSFPYMDGGYGERGINEIVINQAFAE
jgi:hypothetical protein